VGKHGNVAARGLDGGGTHAFRHEAFQIGMDGAVILGDDDGCAALKSDSVLVVIEHKRAPLRRSSLQLADRLP
jgi:hypothetical protein